MATQLPSKIRQDSILMAAVQIACLPNGLQMLTRYRIAEKARCSEGLVSKHLGDMREIRQTVMAYAEEHFLTSILEQDFANLKPELRRRVAKKLL